MGLPSKKQLHKHKRGTRKALDTLDAMDTADEISKPDLEFEDLVIKKKGKGSKKKSVKTKTIASEVEAVATKKSKAKTPSIQNDSNYKSETATSAPSESKATKNVTEEPAQQPSEGRGLVDDHQEKASPEPKPNPAMKSLDLDDDEFKKLENNRMEPKEAANTPIVEDDEIVPGNVADTPQSTHPGTGKKPLTEEEKKVDKQTSSVVPEKSDILLPADEERNEKNSNVQAFDDGEEDAEDTQKDKYLTFRIGDENYGISIRYVTEIIVVQRITEVPDTPAFVKGVINLRGKVIPVIDIRNRFSMELRDYDERTCIIVVEFSETAVGMIVDTVNEVVDIPEKNIDEPPKSHAGTKNNYLEGMGKIDNQVVILLDLNKVLFVEELLRKQRDFEE